MNNRSGSIKALLGKRKTSGREQRLSAWCFVQRWYKWTASRGVLQNARPEPKTVKCSRGRHQHTTTEQTSISQPFSGRSAERPYSWDLMSWLILQRAFQRSRLIKKVQARLFSALALHNVVISDKTERNIKFKNDKTERKNLSVFDKTERNERFR